MAFGLRGLDINLSGFATPKQNIRSYMAMVVVCVMDSSCIRDTWWKAGHILCFWLSLKHLYIKFVTHRGL
jgi:hypothetical protein